MNSDNEEFVQRATVFGYMRLQKLSKAVVVWGSVKLGLDAIPWYNRTCHYTGSVI